MSRTKTIIVFMLLFACVAPLHSQEVVEAIVAVVNDDIITLSEYKKNFDAIYQMLSSQFQGEEFNARYDQLKSNLLETMITELLLLQEARKQDLDVSEQLVMYIENMKKQNNIESDEQLIQAMQQQGINFEDWKDEQEEMLQKQAVIFMEVNRSIVIDESEMLSYYRTYPEEFTEAPEFRIRVIYLSNENKSEGDLQAKMKEIDTRLSNGEEMASLAGEYSEGPEKETQGDLGTFKKGELEKNLEQAVEALEEGQTSSWLSLSNGMYLVRVEEKKESRLKSFDEVRKDIEQKLFTEQSQVKQDEYLKELKSESYIRILIPEPWEY
jgi:parvulin-like peptidyl-prolyl isomerase